MYIVFIRERYYFSLVHTFKRAIKKFVVKVVVQKGALLFRETIENIYASFI